MEAGRRLERSHEDGLPEITATLLLSASELNTTFTCMFMAMYCMVVGDHAVCIRLEVHHT